MIVLSVLQYASPNPDRAAAKKEFLKLAGDVATQWNNRVPTEEGMDVQLLVVGTVGKNDWFQLVWVKPQEGEDTEKMMHKYLAGDFVSNADLGKKALNGFAI